MAVKKYPKITRSAEGQECIRCGKGQGTVRACHYNGLRQHQFGKGRGIKCHDLMTAEFCDECDKLFSEENYPDWEGGSKSIERSEDFLTYISLTNIRRIESGVIKT